MQYKAVEKLAPYCLINSPSFHYVTFCYFSMTFSFLLTGETASEQLQVVNFDPERDRTDVEHNIYRCVREHNEGRKKHWTDEKMNEKDDYGVHI